MPVQYHDLLKTAKALESEQIAEQQKAQLDSIDKTNWRALNETRELIRAINSRIESTDIALDNQEQLGEVQVRSLLAVRKVLKEILEFINT